MQAVTADRPTASCCSPRKTTRGTDNDSATTSNRAVLPIAAVFSVMTWTPLCGSTGRLFRHKMGSVRRCSRFSTFCPTATSVSL